MKYTLEIKPQGVLLRAEYVGSSCSTFCKNFAQAIELLETWYGEDKNVAQWGQKELEDNS
jgi:hypothetical protein